jgi:hypothetical protein
MRRSPIVIAAAGLLVLTAACGNGAGAAKEEPGDRSAGTAASITVAPAAAPTTTTAEPSSAEPDLCAYRGLGTWVDVYDYHPSFVHEGVAPPVTPASVREMADHGVETLYLQVAKDDPRTPGVVTDERLVGEFLTAAHDVGIKVVAWYLPTHGDQALDIARARAMVTFRTGDHRFDGVALDIEGIDAVADVTERNRRLVELVAELDRVADDLPVGSIVYPPVVFDVLNPSLWPDFPWAELASHTDVWLPMAYWTYRDDGSPYRDAYRYTKENVERMVAHAGAPDAPVHVIGGIGDTSTVADYEGFRQAASDAGAIGFSIYDFATFAPDAWAAVSTAPSSC